MILLVNGHQPYDGISPGRLNASYLSITRQYLEASGYQVVQTDVVAGWDQEIEIARILKADAIYYQFPVNSMGLPWTLKRYLDEVFTAGMDGRLSSGDGRSRRDPSRQYGSGGLLSGTRYMLATTLNAPASAFNDPTQTFFAGRSIDDLLWSTHLNFRFFGMEALPTFAAHDVKKGLDYKADLARLRALLMASFPAPSAP